MSEAARAIFLVPPFPGATPHEIVRPAMLGVTPDIEPVTAAQLLTALRQHRVGGAYWQEGNIWSPAEQALHAEGHDPALLLAAIAGKWVHAQGDGPFAQLSALPPGSAQADEAIEALIAQHLIEGVTYLDPFTGAPISPLALVTILAGWRDLIETNRPLVAAFGFANWKRDTVDPLLWGGHAVSFRPARTAELDTISAGASVAVWKARVPPDFLERLEAGPWRTVEVEDGFIRSTGLGADCVPPLSIVLDDLGVHYDPLRPNRLEAMLAQGTFSTDDLARARHLRDWLVREGISKYGVSGGACLPRAGGTRRHILVTGQVEDDRSVQFGGGDVRSNLELLRRVRAGAPDAWIVYRPHPDVEAGHRTGAIPQRTALELADAIDSTSPISALIAMVDEVHVITSLAGFEALLQGKAVTTHGTPFFAGWGLTRDLGAPSPRRGAARTIDELVAAVLLRYPRYLDPLTNLPGTAEILVMRLLSGVQRQNDALVPLRRLVGRAKRAAAQIVGRR